MHPEVLGVGTSTYEFGAGGHNLAHNNISYNNIAYKIVDLRATDFFLPLHSLMIWITLKPVDTPNTIFLLGDVPLPVPA